MNLIKKENFILLIIKYTPLLFVVFFAIIGISVVTSQHNSNLQKEQTNIQKEYLELHKNLTKINIQTVNRYIQTTIDDSEKYLQKDLHQKIDNIYNLAMNIYKKNKDTLSKKQIITQIKNAVEPIRYADGNGYFSIHYMDGINILQPINKDFEGTSVLNRKDSRGSYPVQEAINIAKTKGEGFFNWHYYKPNNRTKEFKKFGIVKKFEPYNLIITTAIFEEDFQNQLKQRILDHLKILEYKDKGYVFVLNKNAKVLLTKPHKLHENVEPFFIKEFKKFINSKEKDIYINYKYNDFKNEYTKISYLLKIDSFDWVVGTGFNLNNLNLLIENKNNELNEEYDKKLKNILIVSFIVIVILLLLSILFSKYLEKIFYTYKNQLMEQESRKFELIKEELSNILDNVPMMFIYKDTHNNILRVNEEFAKMHNYTVEELRNVPSKDVFPLTYKKYYKDDLEIIKTKKAKIGMIQSYMIEDKEVTVETSKIPILNENGEVINIVLFNLDITEKLKKEEERINNYRQTIISLVDLIEQRDFYTAGHSHRVAQYAVKIAEAMNFDKGSINMLEQIGLLHDIGKIAIPDSILLKPGRLSKLEFEIIKSHASIGYDVISKIPMFKEFSNIILSHHERYDGSGYPNGLKGNQIPILASILSVADSFDAMTSTRIYNKTKTVENALNELKKDAGILFDPKIINVAIKALKNIDISANFDVSQLPKTPIEKERFAYFFKDALTDISNENYLELLFKQNLHQYKCLNLILLHNYSSYNDKFGWEKGNKLLVHITNLIKEHYVHEEIFRFQGTNFILLNTAHEDLSLEFLNKELKSYEISCELRHFDVDEFNCLEKVKESLNKI